jgi:thiamine-phosphate pyrophosphorylase
LARRLKLTLVAVTDERRGGDPLALAARLPRGSTLIFRHYDAPDRSVLAIELARICREKRIRLLVAGDAALAGRLRAGLHLPDGLAARPSPAIRLWSRRGRPLTAAAHDRMGIARAGRLGVQAALLSPLFPTLSHPGAKALGLLAFRRLARGAAVPVMAMGGIDRTTVPLVKTLPLAGLAAVSAFNPPRSAAPDGARNGRSGPAEPA